MRLSAFTHGAEALDDEGKNAEVSTAPASQRIAVRTTASRVHMYRVQHTAEPGLPPSLVHLAPALRPAHIVLTQSVDVSAYGCSCTLLAGVFVRPVLACSFSTRVRANSVTAGPCRYFWCDNRTGEQHRDTRFLDWSCANGASCVRRCHTPSNFISLPSHQQHTGTS